MSKKKGSGHTMTLKDFHGGSIPSDLPLPSAPGVMVKPLERSCYERPSPWGNPVGRSDHRSRPHTSPAVKPYDDKSPFFAPTVQIGRNFDEDERKPLDGIAPPRRTISDETIRGMPAPMELKYEYGSTGKQAVELKSGYGSTGRQEVGLGSQVSSVTVVNSFSGGDKVNQGINWGVSLQKSGGIGARGYTGVQPNAWQNRKEVITGNLEPTQSAWAKPTANSKLANASALEKVSSGKWQSKQSIHYQMDASTSGFSRQIGNLQSENDDINSYNRTNILSGREYHSVTLGNSVERGSNMDDGTKGHKQELPEDERVALLQHSTLKELNSNINSAGFQRAQLDETMGRSELHPHVASLPAERPKQNLLPRTMPLEISETSPGDYSHGHQIQGDSVPSTNVQVNRISMKPGLAGEDSGNHAVERPKLNLKPRSQPMKQFEESIVTERSSLFGGARPRELVLKERGIDDVSVNDHDFNQNLERTDHIVPTTERVQRHITPNSPVDKTENHPSDQRLGKQGGWKKDQRVDTEKLKTERKNWRNDNRGNHRETEKQQPLDRPPSPETWRKPVDQPTPALSDATGARYGKAASAIELAKAFSRSVSESKKADDSSGVSGQRSLPGQSQVPFSRLTGPTPRPQINGY